MKTHLSLVEKSEETKTYDRFLEFATQHRRRPHCMPEHRLQLLCRNTHSLLLSRKHTSLSRSFHNMVDMVPVENKLDFGFNILRHYWLEMMSG